jgi:hypothetical protein
MTLAAEESDEVPSRTSMHAHLNEQLPGAAVECAVLDRNSTLPVTWRSVSEEETRACWVPSDEATLVRFPS